MVICQQCKHGNRAGILYCEECGRSLLGLPLNATIPTRTIPNDPDDSSAKSTWGSASIRKGASIVLHFVDAEQPMTIDPFKRLVFGRADADSPIRPDIDLSAYGGLEKGVSRRHAAVEPSEDTLMLFDMGSSNGTFLNGQRLLPNQPRVLRDGDELRFGKLIAHIYFTFK
jgi:hypothetical protein